MSRLLFRVDGHQSIGLGHIIRCIALADMVKDLFDDIIFASQSYDSNILNLIRESGFQLVELPVQDDYERDAQTLIEHLGKDTVLVLDGYNFKESYQLSVKPYCHKLICIDDIHAYHFYADIVINHSEHAKYVKYSCEPYTQLCLGGDYALLRKPFLENVNFKREFKNVENVMICMGGADPTNQTLRIIQALYLTDLKLNLNVIIGTANPNLKSVLQWLEKNKKPDIKVSLHSNLDAKQMCQQFMQNDFLFTPGSTTVLEACCIGIPMIVGIIADNQAGVTETLGSIGAAWNVGWYEDNSLEDIKSFFLYFVEKDKKNIISSQKNVVDTSIVDRYKKILNTIL